MTDYERFHEHGRLREISKKVDPYSLVFENHNKLYIALSSGQTVSANHLHERSDNAVYGWLTTLFLIGMEAKKTGGMKRVHFIGSGYESVKSVYVTADTAGQAIDIAIQMYKEYNWKFHYNEIEVEPYEYSRDTSRNALS